jgi:hypothetical protein
MVTAEYQKPLSKARSRFIYSLDKQEVSGYLYKN